MTITFVFVIVIFKKKALILSLFCYRYEFVHLFNCIVVLYAKLWLFLRRSMPLSIRKGTDATYCHLIKD